MKSDFLQQSSVTQEIIGGSNRMQMDMMELLGVGFPGHFLLQGQVVCSFSVSVCWLN